MSTNFCSRRDCPLEDNVYCNLSYNECPYYTTPIPGVVPKTMFDVIKSFNLDDMAVFLTQLLHERDVNLLESLNEQGIEATLVELPFEAQCEIQKVFLLKEPSDLSEN